ncbi:MAG: DNA recombination protein RmuC, partial [Betaproteobacteria bacterium]
MSFSVSELVLFALAALLFAALVFLVSRLMSLSRQQADLAVRVTDMLEAKHYAMLKDVNDGLNSLGDRLAAVEADNVERLRLAVDGQLRQTREAMVAIQLSQ